MKSGFRSARAAFVLGPLLAVVTLLACGTNNAAVGAGEACFEATDCQDGLVCIPVQNGSRVCSNDLSKVAGKPPGEDAGPPMEAGEGGDAPSEAEPPVDATVEDTSKPDTSKPDTGPADATPDGD